MPRKYECDGCGACCEHMRSPPYLVFFENGIPQKPTHDGSESDAHRAFVEDYRNFTALPPEIQTEVLERKMQPLSIVPDVCPCSWLTEEKQCRFHAQRPDVCREFEPGSEGCQRMRLEHCLPKLKPIN